MTLDEQIEWVLKQHKYSVMMEDGDGPKWLAIYNSLTQLKGKNELSNNNGREITQGVH